MHSIDAALTRLDALEGAASDPDTVAALKRRHEDRRAYFVTAFRDLAEGHASRLRLVHVLTPLESLAPGMVWGELPPDDREPKIREHAAGYLAKKGVAGARFDVRLSVTVRTPS